MTPEQLTQFEEMRKTLAAIKRAEDIQFIQAIARRLEQSITTTVDQKISQTSLGDLVDVDVPSPSNGQVLKYTTSGTDRWIAGTDNTA